MMENAEGAENRKKRKTRWGDLDGLGNKKFEVGEAVQNSINETDSTNANQSTAVTSETSSLEPIKLLAPLPDAAPSTTPESLAAAAAAASLVTGRPIQNIDNFIGGVGGGFDHQQFITNAAKNAQEILEKTRRAAMVQKQIQAQIAAFNMGAIGGDGGMKLMGLTNIVPSSSLPTKILPLRLDKYGREIDEKGNVIQIKPKVMPTLKINMRSNSEQKKPEVPHAKKQENSIEKLVDTSKNSWFDPNLCAKKSKKKALNFIEKGTYVKREKQMAKQAENRALGINMNKLIHQKNTILKEVQQQQIAKLKRLNLLKQKEKQQKDKEQKEKDQKNQKAEGEGEDEDGVDMKEENVGEKKDDEKEDEDKKEDEKEDEDESEKEDDDDEDEFNPNLIPLGGFEGAPTMAIKKWDEECTFEEWDKVLLDEQKTADESYDHDFPYKIKFSLIDDLIEHPVSLKNPAIPVNANVTANMYLTLRERKKLRRRKRQDKERDKQDKVRMGLISAPPVKVKLSNLMRVLGEAAVADPSRVEKDVRSQMESRLKGHEERNEKRRLTAEEKKRKTQNKWKQSNLSEWQAQLFTIESLANKRHLFKIDMNALQLHVTGCCIVCPSLPNIIIAEGGPRATKRFRRLLLKRIKWLEKDEVEEQEDDPYDLSDDEENFKGKNDFCRLVWQGGISSRNFSNWKICSLKTEDEVKQILKNANAEHYWRMITNLPKAPKII